MNLYLIRHTSVDVPAGVCYGQSDVPVKNTFETEAVKVIDQIKHIAFDQVYTSPLSRCRRLANHCGFEQALVDDRLKEIDFGRWELQPWDEITDPNLQDWYQDWQRVAATQGESFNDLYERFERFIHDLPTVFDNIAIFTHGGIINCARVYTGVTTIDKMFDNTPGYGSVTRLTL